MSGIDIKSEAARNIRVLQQRKDEADRALMNLIDAVEFHISRVSEGHNDGGVQLSEALIEAREFLGLE